MTRRKPAKALVAAPPAPPPRIRYVPEWTARYPGMSGSMWEHWRPTTLRLGTIRGPLYLPPFQRAAVWTPGQQVAFCDAMLRGDPTGLILLVEVGWLSGARTYILDGQQRLTALGCDIRRHDGTANPATAARFHVHTGEWGAGDGTYSLAEAARYDFDMFGAALDHSEQRVDALVALHDRAHQIDLPAYVRRYHHPTPEAGAEMSAAFASINAPGTPIHPDDVAALRSFGAGWIPEIEVPS